jgi:hypothetical protein
MEKRDQQKVRTREKEREREQRKLFLFFYSEQRALCVVRFFVTFGEHERTAWTGKRSADICTRAELLVRVCDNSTKRYKNIYINKEKIPLDLSLSLSLSCCCCCFSSRFLSRSRRSLFERGVFTSFVLRSIFCFLFLTRVSVSPFGYSFLFSP